MIHKRWIIKKQQQQEKPKCGAKSSPETHTSLSWKQDKHINYRWQDNSFYSSYQTKVVSVITGEEPVLVYSVSTVYVVRNEC